MHDVMIFGVYLYGAMYTTGVFVAALVLRYRGALHLSLVSAGSAYFAQYAGVFAHEEGFQAAHTAWVVCALATAVSVLAGIAAGLSLIAGV